MQVRVKTILTILGIRDHMIHFHRFCTTIRLPRTYQVDFAGNTVVFLTDRPYTKWWFHRNRSRGAHNGWHEPSITTALETLARVTSNFIDVGSHLGYFSILFSSIPGNRSLAIELDPSNFAELRRSVTFQPPATRVRIEIVHCGASDRADTIHLPAKRALSPGYSIPGARPGKGYQVKVSLFTLDELSRLHRFVPDIVKIDVEGCELSVLRGAANILAERKPIIIIEVHPEHMCRQGHDPLVLSEFLRQRGYLLYSFEDHRSLCVSSLKEIQEITRIDDHVIVCVHEDDLDRRALLTSNRAGR